MEPFIIEQMEKMRITNADHLSALSHLLNYIHHFTFFFGHVSKFNTQQKSLNIEFPPPKKKTGMDFEWHGNHPLMWKSNPQLPQNSISTRPDAKNCCSEPRSTNENYLGSGVQPTTTGWSW